jgi:hypothetical protein
MRFFNPDCELLRWLRSIRLGDVTRVVQEKNSDLLIWLVADVDCPMNAITRLLPVDLAGCGLNVLAGTAVAEFNRQNLTGEDNG